MSCILRRRPAVSLQLTIAMPYCSRLMMAAAADVCQRPIAHMERERERDRETDRQTDRDLPYTHARVIINIHIEHIQVL